MSIRENEPYLEKLGKLTPVYIIGLMTAIEPMMGIIRDRTPEEQIVAVLMVFGFGIVAFFVAEVGKKKLSAERKAQLGVTLVSTILYLFLETMRMLGVDLITVYFGFVPLLFTGAWTLIAPLLVDYAPNWRIHVR
jgi:hypothetical protein